MKLELEAQPLVDLIEEKQNELNSKLEEFKVAVESALNAVAKSQVEIVGAQGEITFQLSEIESRLTDIEAKLGDAPAPTPDPEPDPPPDPEPEPDPEPIPDNDFEINVSRVSGYAPLSVSFSALQLGEDTFHNSYWTWSFEDADLANWTTSDKSKNVAFEPVAAHVFHTPGVHRVECIVENETGETKFSSIEIEVLDPAELETYYFSSSGFSEDKPNQIFTADFRTILSYVAPGRRLLLRRGDTFQCSGSTTLNVDGPGLVDTFGDGARPKIVCNSDMSVINVNNASKTLRDWRFVNLEVVNGSSATPSGVFLFTAAGGQLYQTSLIGCRFEGFRIGVYTSPNFETRPEDLAIVECEIAKPYHVGLFISGHRFVVMGNTIEVVEREHGIRSHMYSESVFAHNIIQGSKGNIRHCMKMCSLSTNAAQPNGTNGENELVKWSGLQAARDWVIAYNKMYASNIEIPLAIGPQSAQYDERVYNGVVVNNEIIGGPNTVYGVWLAASKVSFTHNDVDVTARPCTAVRVLRRGVEYSNGVHPEPRGNVLEVNTFRGATNGVSVDSYAQPYNTVGENFMS